MESGNPKIKVSVDFISLRLLMEKLFHASLPVSTKLKFLGIQWYGASWDTPSQVKNHLVHLPLPMTKSKGTAPVDLHGFWRQYTIFFVIVGTQYYIIVSSVQIVIRHFYSLPYDPHIESSNHGDSPLFLWMCSCETPTKWVEADSFHLLFIQCNDVRLADKTI